MQVLFDQTNQSKEERREEQKEPEHTMLTDEDQHLFQKFFQGDDGALANLFDKHTPRFYLYALKFLGDSLLAEDVVQDVWEKIIKLRTERTHPPGNSVGYMVRMIRNHALNRLRDRRHHNDIESLPEAEHPRVTLHPLSQEEEILNAALHYLPDAQRELLILHNYAGYKFEEIAVMQNEHVSTIRTRAWRARKELARIVSIMITATDSEKHRND